MARNSSIILYHLAFQIRAGKSLLDFDLWMVACVREHPVKSGVPSQNWLPDSASVRLDLYEKTFLVQAAWLPAF